VAWQTPNFAAIDSPYLTIDLAKDDLRASFFTIAAGLGTPYDVTRQEIRLELFYPAGHHPRAVASLVPS